MEVNFLPIYFQKGFRKHSTKGDENKQSLSVDKSSPKNSRKFNIKSPIKSKKSNEEQSNAHPTRPMHGKQFLVIFSIS